MKYGKKDIEILNSISRKHDRILYKALRGDERSIERIEKIIQIYEIGMEDLI